HRSQQARPGPGPEAARIVEGARREPGHEEPGEEELAAARRERDGRGQRDAFHACARPREVKRTTRFFLLAGCAFVLILEAPLTLSTLLEGWRGPYPESGARSAALTRKTSAVSPTILAVLPRD